MVSFLSFFIAIYSYYLVNAGCPSGETCVPQTTGQYPDADISRVNACNGIPQTGTISISQIASAWKLGGGNPVDCAAALIIATGECQPPATTGPGSICDIAGSGAGGVWQVTSPQGAIPCNNPGSNTCCNVMAVKAHFTAPPSGQAAWNAACYHNVTGKPTLNAPQIVPTDHSGGSLGGTQYNWIGPFCHCGIFHTGKPQTGFSGDQWGGGSLWVGAGHGNQAYPYPYYYYDLFNQRVLDTTVKCTGLTNGKAPSSDTTACLNKMAQTAITGANKYCSSIYSNITGTNKNIIV